MKKVLYVFVSLVVFGICAGILLQNREQFAVLHNLQVSEVFALTALTFVFFTVGGYTFKFLLEFLAVQLTFAETIGLSILTNFGNYLGPMGPGAILRAVYLKSVKGMKYSQYAAVFAAHNFLSFGVTALAGVIMFFLFKVRYPDTPPLILWWCLGILCAGIVPLLVKIPSVRWPGRLGEAAGAAIEGFRLIGRRKGGLVLVGFAYILQLAVRAALLTFCFSALGGVLPFWDSFSVVVYMSLFDFAITPGNVGIQEGIGGYFLMLAGADFGITLVALAFLRAVHFGLTFLLTPLVMLQFFRTLNWQRVMVQKQ